MACCSVCSVMPASFMMRLAVLFTESNANSIGSTLTNSSPIFCATSIAR